MGITEYTTLNAFAAKAGYVSVFNQKKTIFFIAHFTMANLIDQYKRAKQDIWKHVEVLGEDSDFQDFSSYYWFVSIDEDTKENIIYYSLHKNTIHDDYIFKFYSPKNIDENVGEQYRMVFVKHTDKLWNDRFYALFSNDKQIKS